MMPMAEFNFDSACTTPYVSAPSSPRGFGSYYTSAPTSPSRAAAFYHHLRSSASSYSVGPFDWEPQSRRHEVDGGGEDEEESGGGEEKDFAFEFSGQLVMGDDDALTATADELFEAGKIRPLKPPLRLHIGPGNGSPYASAVTSPRSPRSRLFWSPRHRSKPDGDYEPFIKAAEETIRGRDRTVENVGEGKGSRRATRSLSPLRIAPDLCGKLGGGADIGSDSSTSCVKGGGSKKWRFRDLFLFRSASEGRVSDGKDPLRKYTALAPAVSRRVAADEEARNASFRSTVTEGSAGGSSRRAGRDGGSAGGSSRKGGASAHERHYTANRAVSEERRRRTFLPYRQGLLGCLVFNPAIDGLVKGFGFGQSSRA